MTAKEALRIGRAVREAEHRHGATSRQVDRFIAAGEKVPSHLSDAYCYGRWTAKALADYMAAP